MKSLPRAADLAVTHLGEARSPSPLRREHFVDEAQRVLVCKDTEELRRVGELGGRVPAFERAGPRESLFLQPDRLTCGIVSCGGLCPGINNVIRAIVLHSHYAYGVRRVLGFRYGYSGLARPDVHEPWALEPRAVAEIHELGGSILGSSRGPQDPGQMVDTLVRHEVGLLFAVGGDGTLRGASALSHEIARRGLSIAVVGIPKTIDNDLCWVERSFGFSTAVEEAARSIIAAHTEAIGAWNGVGVLKLMGRHSGFIAAHASLARSDVNFCLVPEVPFELDGPGGFLAALTRRLEEKHHAVVVVAEGAGQELMADESRQERDASGNVRLKDVGPFVCEAVRRHAARIEMPMEVRYLDPSYTIRSLPANALDSEYCLQLGQHAVHAGMAGATDMMVGHWNNRFTHVPLAQVAGRRKHVDPDSPLWHRVLEATGQPASMT